jgi:hypothetical protein
MGLGKESERPDRVRGILDFIRLDDGLPGGVLYVWEVSEGGIGNAFTQGMTLSALEQNIWVFHIPLRGRKKVFQPRGREMTEEMLLSLQDEEFDLCRFR